MRLWAHSHELEPFETPWLRAQDIPRVTASLLLSQEEGAAAIWGWGLQPPADGCLPLHSLSDNRLSVAGAHCVLRAASACRNLADLHIR